MKKLTDLVPVLACAMLASLAACSGGSSGVESTLATPATTHAEVPAPDPGEDPEPVPVAPPALPGDEDVPDVTVEDDGPGGMESPAGGFTLAGYAPPVQEPAPEPPAAVTLAQAGAKTLYVAPNGSDSNPGTEARPLRTISKASRLAGPGTAVLVAPGVYNGGFRTTANGRADARISYISTSKWGAKIVPPKGSRTRAGWDNRGSYVDIVGFEVDGSNYESGVRWTHGIYNGGSYDAIRNNRVHHIAQGIGCNAGGGAAIGIDSYYHGVHSDVISNLVHDIGPAGCHFVQGIYVSTSGSVKNNVVYRVAEAGIHLWHDANNVVITNNTVTRSNTGIIVGGGNFYHTRGPNDHTAVYSNIVYDNRIGISEQGRTGVNNAYRNNLVYNNSRYNWRLKNGLTHSGTVSAPPLFVAELLSGTPELKPSGASPAVGQATPAHAASTDFAGRSRNARTGYDIGAFQH
ncbi:DUF1565 domain-containing protein [Massilia cavernae]|uniref:DUF1565 domain-containing protein n=1 Tax=Massilia cavernae TaxID=2320864 RepID=A0A418Y8H2_9BURK|nr:DUF1565 domain-containing protein [Massilia cavernae]RJG27664.1 DUF1565 domain-containing protein [Massilia cavernae]